MAAAAAREAASTAAEAAQDGRDVRPAPEDLGEAGRLLWHAVVGEYDVQDWQLPVVEAAAREADRAADAEAAVRADGAYIHDRYGAPKAHPAVAVARSSRLAVARLLRGLNLEPPEQHPGPGNWRRGMKR